jgi:uncharacterized protein (TIGR02118 family)
MIKVSVMYANTPGARFDHTYLIKARLGNACKHYSVDKGLAGEPAPYVGMCHIYCDSMEAFDAALVPHAAETTADIANYTDLRPVFQIGEVVVG